MSIKIPFRLRSISFLIIILSVVFLGFADHNSIGSDENILHITNSVTSNYSDYSPITISNNSDFQNQGWIGNGTEENPFRIEGLHIVSDSVCIDVANSSVFFEIKDCVFSSLTRWDGVGVRFTDVENGRVIDCQFDNLFEGIVFDSVSNCKILETELHWNYFHGVRIQSSSYCYLENNTCSDNFYSGFHLLRTSNCIVTGNELNNNSDYGLELNHVSNSTFTNNIAHNNWWYGFLVWYCSNNTFRDNHIKNHVYGVHLWDSTLCKFINNQFQNDSILVTGEQIITWTHVLIGNTLNGRPLGYFVNLSDTEIDCDPFGGVIFVNCQNVSIKGGVFGRVSSAIQMGLCSNCTVEGMTVTNRVFHSLRICYSSDIVVHDCNMEFGYYGVRLTKTPNFNIYNNSVSEGYIGYYIWNSPNGSLTNNRASNYLYGAYAFMSQNVSFKENTVHESHSGICISTMSNCTLEGNYVYDNYDYGLRLLYSRACVVKDNTASGNKFGIYLFKTSVSTISVNRVFHNSFGIYLDTMSQDNYIHSNIVGPNNKSNANDEGSQNIWDGNYWNDFDGSSNYTISGVGDGVDRVPCQLAIEIDSPEDLNYTSETFGHTIIWETSSPLPSTYRILRNGSIIESGLWDDTQIQLAIDGLVVGSHNFTIVLIDIFGNRQSDTVIVEVFQVESQTPNTIMIVSLGIAAAAITMVGLVIKKR